MQNMMFQQGMYDMNNGANQMIMSNQSQVVPMMMNNQSQMNQIFNQANMQNPQQMINPQLIMAQQNMMNQQPNMMNQQNMMNNQIMINNQNNMNMMNPLVMQQIMNTMNYLMQQNMIQQNIINQLMTQQNISNQNVSQVFNLQQLQNNMNIFQPQAEAPNNITVRFEGQARGGRPPPPINIQCNLNDKVSTLLQAYRKKTKDYDPEIKFIFNSKRLHESITLDEAGINNNSLIFVLNGKNLTGGNYFKL